VSRPQWRFVIRIRSRLGPRHGVFREASRVSLQACVADVLEQIAASGSEVFTVPKSHRAAILEGLEQAERREFMNDDEMAALWKKCGL
jgi:predicted transcriptional regulator